MSILILGHAKHGKDEFAARLCKHVPLRFASSSETALVAIYPVLTHILREEDKRVLFENRSEHRELWRLLIELYNTPDKAALSKLILHDKDVYVGMRTTAEFQASKHLFDLVVWVDGSKRKPLEPSMQIQQTDDMVYIDNNGSLEDLETQVVEFVNNYKEFLC